MSAPGFRGSDDPPFNRTAETLFCLCSFLDNEIREWTHRKAGVGASGLFGIGSNRLGTRPRVARHLHPSPQNPG